MQCSDAYAAVVCTVQCFVSCSVVSSALECAVQTSVVCAAQAAVLGAVQTAVVCDIHGSLIKMSSCACVRAPKCHFVHTGRASVASYRSIGHTKTILALGLRFEGAKATIRQYVGLT